MHPRKQRGCPTTSGRPRPSPRLWWEWREIPESLEVLVGRREAQEDTTHREREEEGRRKAAEEVAKEKAAQETQADGQDAPADAQETPKKRTRRGRSR
jgi:hypothetical protein